MKIVVPSYYSRFSCLADKCKNTCCAGWEIDVDKEKLNMYLAHPDIAYNISTEGTPHFILKNEDRCPFLNESNLCDLIIKYGDGILCQICRDHPRFRNYWTDRIEVGLGLVCEEACRIILTNKEDFKLIEISDDGAEDKLDDTEKWLMSVRKNLLSDFKGEGTSKRLYEYLVYRYLADALYDGRLEERIKFIDHSYNEVLDLWKKTSSIEEQIDITRQWSYRVEYDEEEIEKRISSYSNK